jgi:hypothetical protein
MHDMVEDTHCAGGRCWWHSILPDSVMRYDVAGRKQCILQVDELFVACKKFLSYPGGGIAWVALSFSS